VIFLPQPPKCWDYKQVPPYQERDFLLKGSVTYIIIFIVTLQSRYCMLYLAEKETKAQES
jgi:hypothetical protein